MQAKEAVAAGRFSCAVIKFGSRDALILIPDRFPVVSNIAG